MGKAATPTVIWCGAGNPGATHWSGCQCHEAAWAAKLDAARRERDEIDQRASELLDALDQALEKKVPDVRALRGAAFQQFWAWQEVSGHIGRGSSLYGEVEACIEEAFRLGALTATAERDEKPEAAKLPDFIRCVIPRGECCHQRMPPVIPLEAPECNDGDDCCRYCGRGLQPCGACRPAPLPPEVREAAEAYRRLRGGTGGAARLLEMRHQACRLADLVLSALDARGGAE